MHIMKKEWEVWEVLRPLDLEATAKQLQLNTRALPSVS